MKAGDIVRRKIGYKIFVGSYYYVLQVGANYMCALKLNSDDNIVSVSSEVVETSETSTV